MPKHNVSMSAYFAILEDTWMRFLIRILEIISAFSG